VRMPYELSRRNFKNAQRVIEHHSSTLTTALAGASKTPDPTAALDSIISKMQGLKRKLEVLHDEELRIHKAARARLSHLQSLYSIPSLTSVQYDEWSRTRLSRLLVDYLLRSGFSSSAAHLASSKGITDLVDVEPFVACHKIEKSLRGGRSTAAALEWCKEHGKELKKMGGRLEFELRLQQYIELVREGHELGMAGADDEGVRIGNGGGEKKLVEAMSHAKKWLAGSGDAELLQRAAGLLAFRPWEGVEPYAACLFPTDLWWIVANLVVTDVILTHPLDTPLLALPLNAPHALLAPSEAPPTHSPQRRALRLENTRMPLPNHQIHDPLYKPLHTYDAPSRDLGLASLPHLQHGAQRTRAQRPVCASHEEHSPPGRGGAAEWARARER